MITKLPNDVEGLFIQFNLRNKKCILFAGYNPKKERISHFLNNIGTSLDKFIEKFDNLLLIGDFNSEIEEENMKEFREVYNLQNLIKEPTCFKSIQNPTSIDVILTNRCKNFHSSCTIETGLSDHHKMTITVLKIYYKKLNKHAPIKEKTIRGNNAPFMNKTLSKAFMERSKLKNIYNKFPTDENQFIYKKQRNYCVNLLKKEKRNDYSNIDINIFEDNKYFWKVIKPLFSEKVKTFQKELILIEDDVVISNAQEVAEKMNTFFVEAVKNLDIEPYNEEIITGINSHDIIDDIVMNFSQHPSILKIKSYLKITVKFSFRKTKNHEFQNQMQILDSKKSSC